ncbi:hypothetical protein PCASD_14970 [Puccinia coronata f. sp. avenae]|uniref:Cdc37 Hsp90 binding domain-containing protein n=1 Tax=Puccinia coronata f. sp. avenae TaxID=200324 RepID=A0A2N5U7B8_9BASI|nr:hypothetical protein PCASD_14970 [Puccinia coronata f. sp. avenae]
MSEAIDAEMDGKATYAQNCVHQYLVLQNCLRLYVRDPNCSMLSKVLSGQWAPHVSIEEINPVYQDILRRVPGLRQLRQFVHGTQDLYLLLYFYPPSCYSTSFLNQVSGISLANPQVNCYRQMWF